MQNLSPGIRVIVVDGVRGSRGFGSLNWEEDLLGQTAEVHRLQKDYGVRCMMTSGRYAGRVFIFYKQQIQAINTAEPKNSIIISKGVIEKEE